MEPKIIKKDTFQIIGIQFRGNNDNNACPKLWDKFIPRMGEVMPFVTQPVTSYGVCSDFDMEENIFTYTVGFQVKDLSTIPPNMISLKIPEQKYAVFTCSLPTIIKTIEHIYKKWIPSSGLVEKVKFPVIANGVRESSPRRMAISCFC